MAVKDIQRRHMTVFNVRFGEKTKNGAPAKLKDQLRITSPNPSVVQAFADVYGGTPRPWNGDEWEVYIPRTDLPIFLLAGQSITQWWTQYKGSVCERRCDGETEQLSKKACMCPADIDQRVADKYACSLETRLNFICPEVKVMGAGALVTRSLIGGETLPQAIQVAEQALAAGQMVPATLRAVQKVGKGRQYVVPQIEITGISLHEMMAGELSSGGPQAPAIASAGAKAALPAAGQRAGGSGEVVEAETRSLPADTASQGSARTSSPSTGSVSPAATAAQRSAITKQAERKGLSADQVEELVLEATGKYLDEADFSVDHVNKVLDALAKR